MEYIPFSNYWNHLARFGDICIRKETCYKNQEQSCCVTKTNISFIILMKIIHLLHVGYFANLWVTDECSGDAEGEYGQQNSEVPKTFLARLHQEFWVVLVFLIEGKRVKRQQQNFFLLPRLGIPLKNDAGLAIHLHLGDSIRWDHDWKKVFVFSSKSSVCSYGETCWELLQEFLLGPPCQDRKSVV